MPCFGRPAHGYPDDVRGWAEYARCFAERYEWRNCRLAVERSLALPCLRHEAADALLTALALLAEHQELQDLD